jgi:hypothetical protein
LSGVVAAGLRRFLTVLAMASVVAAIVGIVLAALAGESADRGIAIGFYVVGSLLLVGGFFVGNRGPVRATGAGGLPVLGARFLRWATREELDEAINASAVYVSLGFALILLGVAAESV